MISFTGEYEMKKIFSLIVMCVCLCSLFFCSSCGDQKENGGPYPITQFEPLTDIREGRPDIYLIIKVMDSSYWKVIVNGAKDAGEYYDCNIYYGGTNNETDWQGQRTLIEEAVYRNADAIILSPDDSITLVPDIESIHDKGIPIALVDTAVNSEKYDICYMTDNLLAGQIAAREMLRQLHELDHDENEEASIGIMVGTAASQTINERLAGFYQYWSNNAPEKWVIVSDIMNCNGNIDNGGKLADDFLKKNPGIDGLYGTNNGPTRLLCRAVTDHDLKDTIVVGFDYSDEMKNLIENSDYRASTILQRQYDMSYKAVDTLMQLLDGKTPSVKFEDTGVVIVNRDVLTDPDVVEVLKHN